MFYHIVIILCYTIFGLRYLERIQLLKTNFARAHVEAEKLNAKAVNSPKYMLETTGEAVRMGSAFSF